MARAGAFLMPSTMGLEWRRGSSWLIGNLGRLIGPVYGELIGRKGKATRAISHHRVLMQDQMQQPAQEMLRFSAEGEGMAMVVPSRAERKTGTDRGEAMR